MAVPPLLAGPNGFPVPPNDHVVGGLIGAVLAADRHVGVAYHRWQLDRVPAMVNRWYADAVAHAGSHSEV